MKIYIFVFSCINNYEMCNNIVLEGRADLTWLADKESPLTPSRVEGLNWIPPNRIVWLKEACF